MQICISIFKKYVLLKFLQIITIYGNPGIKLMLKTFLFARCHTDEQYHLQNLFQTRRLANQSAFFTRLLYRFAFHKKRKIIYRKSGDHETVIRARLSTKKVLKKRSWLLKTKQAKNDNFIIHFFRTFNCQEFYEHLLLEIRRLTPRNCRCHFCLNFKSIHRSLELIDSKPSGNIQRDTLKHSTLSALFIPRNSSPS